MISLRTLRRLLPVFALAAATPAWATLWVVDSSDSISDTSSLRYALTNLQAGDSITLPSGLGSIALTADLPAITVNVSIEGNSNTINAVGHRGLVVYSGTVTISDLIITGASAVGGAGGTGGTTVAGSGGGGAGLGGALFIGSTNTTPQVTLSNVNLSTNTAVGGAGGTGTAGIFGGGGGGMGGNGGAGEAFGAGGGGGFGAIANGGAGAMVSLGTGGVGAAGIIPGIAAAGSGFGGHNTSGGIDGGGGGTGLSSAGGGGVDGTTPTNANGGNGGFGGGGGSVGVNDATGGAGGFGGGGAGGGLTSGNGGNAGFGGGLGSAFSGGSSTFGGGFGDTSGNGGGGGGMGGGLFVVSGATVTLAGPLTVNGNTVTAGASGGGTATAGSAFGPGIFIQGNTTLTFSPSQGVAQVVSDEIDDEHGNINGDSNMGSIVMNGSGTLTLSAANGNKISGTVAVSAGTLLVTNTANSAVGTAPVTVSGTGTFGGTGIVGAAVTVDTGATLAGGNGALPLTLSNSALTWSGTVTSSYTVDDDAQTTPAIAITGTGTFVGTGGTAFIVDFLGAGTLGNTYTIITYPASSTTDITVGQFQAINLPANEAATFTVGSTSVTATIVTAAANTITSASSASGTYGTPGFSYQITADNSPQSFSIGGVLPAGVTLDSSSGLLSGTPMTAGIFNLTLYATGTQQQGTSSAPLTLTIAPAALTLSGVVANDKTYDGTANASLDTSGAELVGVIGSDDVTPDFTNAVAAFPSADAGTGLTVTISGVALDGTSAANYTLTQPAATASILPAPATVTLSGLSYVYTGTAEPATASTSPASLPVSITYNGSATVPTNAGTYAVAATISNPDYSGTATGNYVITPIPATVTLGSLAQTYTGSALTASASTNPTGLPVSYTYNGSATQPTNAGTYAVVGTISNGNYSGSATGTLVVSPATATVILGSLNAGYTGNAITASATTVPANIPVAFTYNGSSTEPTMVGSYAVIGTVSSANYTGSGSGTLVIGKGTPPISWSTPAPIVVGTTLSSAQLDATSTTAGSFVYTPAAGSTLPVGVQTLSAAFTPTDTVNWAPTTGSTSILVQPKPNALVNISALGQASVGANALIAGFVINGSAPQSVLLRGVGPGLNQFGIGGFLPDPVITLYDGNDNVIATNTVWGGGATLSTAFTLDAAFALSPTSADSALITTLNPGAYSMVVTSASGQTGTALAEAYINSPVPLNQPTIFTNISSRASVGPASNNLLTAGFVIGGSTPAQMLIRADGPSLAGFGLTNAIAQPYLQLYSGSTLVAQNQVWGTGLTVANEAAPANAGQIAAAAAEVGAFPFISGSDDSAILVSLQPGDYSAHVYGAGSSSGIVLLEVYQLP